MQGFLATTGISFPVLRLAQYLQDQAYFGIYYDNYLVIDANGIVRYTSVNELRDSDGRFDNAHLRSAILNEVTAVGEGLTPSPAFTITNPIVAGSETLLRLRAPAPPGTRVTLHDVHGRLLRPLETPPAGGWQSLAWPALGPAGEELPAGVYFVRLQLPAAPSRSRKLVVIRR